MKTYAGENIEIKIAKNIWLLYKAKPSLYG